MAYVALYRKFRPQCFEELVGQEYIVRTLLNQLESGRIAHAYLFSGPRGTGKTSTAKLFARAVNCAHPVNGNPCGECDACKAFVADGNMDIIEIDAASNNGVDNIRDIRDKVVFAPAYGKYKVYIIDEVHMLSPGAFNALLKTLEEPPKHVVFILATTEIHKLPATILSRCQRFDFRLIPSKTIHERLETVLTEVGASFDEDAIDLIAKNASGGMRDALSLADVCLSYCGNNVTLQDAMNVLGISDRSFVFSFAEALLEGNSTLALEKCFEAENDGRDIGVLILELMEHMRDIMLCIYSPESEEIKALPNEMILRLKEQAKPAYAQRALRSIEILSKLEGEIKLHSRPEIQLEAAAVRICSPELENDISALEDRISSLESKIKNGAFVQNSASINNANEGISSNTDMPPWYTDTNTQTAPSEPMQSKSDDAPRKTASDTTQNAKKIESTAPKQNPVSGNSLHEGFLARVKSEDLPLYMMIRNFSSEVQENKFIIYIPEKSKTKEDLIARNTEKLENILESLAGKRLKLETFIGEKVQNGQGEDATMMKAALDLFS